MSSENHAFGWTLYTTPSRHKTNKLIYRIKILLRNLYWISDAFFYFCKSFIELWQITHDDQYSDIIKPALETCHEVTCIEFLIGGSLCNIFTMCTNMGEDNLDMADGEGERTWNETKKNHYTIYLFQ